MSACRVAGIPAGICLASRCVSMARCHPRSRRSPHRKGAAAPPRLQRWHVLELGAELAKLVHSLGEGFRAREAKDLATAGLRVKVIGKIRSPRRSIRKGTAMGGGWPGGCRGASGVLGGLRFYAG